MADADVFTWVPDYSAQQDVSARLQKASFGDGYTQRLPAGINFIDDVWNWTFTRSVAEISDITAFLRNHMDGRSFLLNLPRGAGQAKVVVGDKGFSQTEEGYDVQKLTVAFERVPV